MLLSFKFPYIIDGQGGFDKMLLFLKLMARIIANGHWKVYFRNVLWSGVVAIN